LAVATALPPWHLFPLLVPGLCGAVWLMLRAPTRKQAFARGWWFGFGYFVLGLYWISYSLLVDAKQFAWMIPFSLTLIPAACAVYSGLVALLLHLSRRQGLAALLCFALLWSGSEWLRGQLFSGFPWNPVAVTLAWSDALLQPAAYLRVWGLSALLLLWASMPLLITSRRRIVPLLSLWVGAGLSVWAWGNMRVSQPILAGEAIPVRMVQGNVPQSMKWDEQRSWEFLQRYIRLSKGPGWEQQRIILWPETAVPFVAEPQAQWLFDLLAQAVPPGGVLITGVVRREGAEVWNSIIAVNAQGRVVAHYDKRHLVPFGEYIPFRWLLPIERIAPGMGDFSVGHAGGVLEVPGIPVARPLICYEAIFPELANQTRGSWLLALTNDAWFGDSAGPYQHLAHARLRAVEQGIPLLRAANTGISAVVEPSGRVTQHLPIGQMGVLDTNVVFFSGHNQ
jgi:apolipoprotein N-acyltransferase